MQAVMGDNIKGGFHIQEGDIERFTLVFVFSGNFLKDQGAIHWRRMPGKPTL